MALTFAFPFRLEPNGTIAVVEEDSDAGEAQALAILVLTRRNERALVPGYGITDPAFAGVEPTEIAAGAAAYGPDVDVAGVDVTELDEGRQLVRVVYT